MFDIKKMAYIVMVAKRTAAKRRHEARLAELLAQPKPAGWYPTLSHGGPCSAVPGGHVDGANLRMFAPWPGLKPLARAAVGQ